MGPIFKKLAEKLSEAYDLVFFDTPPILAVTDASIIGPHCSTNMVVARFGTCTAGEIAAGCKTAFILTALILRALFSMRFEKRAGGYYYGEPSYYSSGSPGGYHKAASDCSCYADPTIASIYYRPQRSMIC